MPSRLLIWRRIFRDPLGRQVVQPRIAEFDLSMFDIYVAMKTGGSGPGPENLRCSREVVGIYFGNVYHCLEFVSSVLSLLAVRGPWKNTGSRITGCDLFGGGTSLQISAHPDGAHERNRFLQHLRPDGGDSSTFYKVDAVPENDGWKIPSESLFRISRYFFLDDEGKPVEDPGREGNCTSRDLRSPSGIGGCGQDAGKVRPGSAHAPIHGSVFTGRRPGSIRRGWETCILGRKDHLVKSRGYRIELDEVEWP